MAVGSLLHVEIVPCVDVCVVAPGLHAGQQIVCRLRRAAQCAVDHRHHFGAGDRCVGTERAVGIAVDPAHLCADSDFIRCPVSCRDIVEGVCSALDVRKLRQHCSKLCARDCLIRTELAVRSGVDDHVGIFKRCNVEVEPVAAGNIAERASGRFIRLDTICIHDAIEDCSHFCARHIAGGLYRAVRIAVDEGEVVIRVERKLGCLRLYLVRRLDDRHSAAVALSDVVDGAGNVAVAHCARDRRVILIIKLVALDIRGLLLIGSIICKLYTILGCYFFAGSLVEVLDRQPMRIDAPVCLQRMIFGFLHGVRCGNLVAVQIPALKGMMGAGRSRQVAVRSIKGDFLARLADRSVVRVGVEGHGVGVRFPLGS